MTPAEILVREFPDLLARLGDRAPRFLTLLSADGRDFRERFVVAEWLFHVAPKWEMSEVVRATLALTESPADRWVTLFDGRFVRRAGVPGTQVYDPVNEQWVPALSEWSIVYSLNVRKALGTRHADTPPAGRSADARPPG